jgi:hypothetical protein
LTTGKIYYFVAMEPLLPEETSPDENSNLCKNCKVNPIAEGYPNPLCEACRQQFIKFPIPAWVKGFGIGVIVLVLIGLISFPKQISIGIHLKRAEAAISKKKYWTAEKELRKVLAAAPGMNDAKAQMLIASYYNLDMETLVTMIDELKTARFEKGEQFNTIQEIVNETRNFLPSDSLLPLLKEDSNKTNIQEQFRSYIFRHPDEPFAISTYVATYFEKDRSDWCDSIIHHMLNENPAYLKGIMAAIYIERAQHHYDTALNYCRQLLTMNEECSYAIAAEARISLAQGNLSEGIALAKKAWVMDSADGFNIATLALGYHLNHQSAERDHLIASKASDSSVSYYMEYVKQVMDGKAKFN